MTAGRTKVRLPYEFSPVGEIPLSVIAARLVLVPVFSSADGSLVRPPLLEELHKRARRLLQVAERQWDRQHLTTSAWYWDFVRDAICVEFPRTRTLVPSYYNEPQVEISISQLQGIYRGTTYCADDERRRFTLDFNPFTEGKLLLVEDAPRS